MSTTDIALTTSDGKKYKVTLNPATGDGILHPVEDFCDKVRIKNYKLDNSDNIFYVDYFLEEEWDDLLKAALSERAEAWLKSEHVIIEVQKLERLELELEEEEDKYLARRRMKVLEHTNILKSLHQYAAENHAGGLDSLEELEFDGCSSTPVMVISKGAFEIKEIL